MIVVNAASLAVPGVRALRAPEGEASRGTPIAPIDPVEAGPATIVP